MSNQATQSQLNVKLGPDLYEALTTRAGQERRSRTEVIREALRVYLSAEATG